jgi:hypothetical protein
MSGNASVERPACDMKVVFELPEFDNSLEGTRLQGSGHERCCGASASYLPRCLPVALLGCELTTALGRYDIFCSILIFDSDDGDDGYKGSSGACLSKL